MNSLIEYTGICEKLPENIKKFKQFIVTDTIKLTVDKNPIRDIIKVATNYRVMSEKLVKTSKGISLEGESLVGYKYMSKGFFDVKVYYEENSDEGRLGLLSKKIKFFEGILLEEEIISSKRNIINIYIEDIYAEATRGKEVFVAITAMAIFEGAYEYE